MTCMLRKLAESTGGLSIHGKMSIWLYFINSNSRKINQKDKLSFFFFFLRGETSALIKKDKQLFFFSLVVGTVLNHATE